MKLFTHDDLQQAARYLFLNLATPICFYVAFHYGGAKSAIGFAVLVTLFQLLVHGIYRIPPSAVFIVASGFTVLFGVIDLCLQSPRFFRLEPFAQNVLIGTALIVSVTFRIPIAVWFIEGLPKKIRPNLSLTGEVYLRNLTLFWAFYLYLKAFIFLYLAFKVDLGTLVLLRSVVGGGSLVLMFLAEFVYRNHFRVRKS